MTQQDENSTAMLRGPETSHKLTQFLTNVWNVRSGAEKVSERRSRSLFARIPMATSRGVKKQGGLTMQVT